MARGCLVRILPVSKERREVTATIRQERRCRVDGASPGLRARVITDPSRWGAALSLRLLGRFSLTVGDDELMLSLAARRLVTLLALQRRPLLRGLIAGTLWPDGGTMHANGSLRTALWRVRVCDPEIVRATSTEVALTDAVAVDLDVYEARARAMLAGSITADDVHLFADAPELLPGWYDDWLLVHQESWRQLRSEALEAAGACLARPTTHQLALEAALAAVRIDPLRESAHRAVILLHLRHRNYHDAARQYRLCVRLFATRLHAAPSSELQLLMQRAYASDVRATAASAEVR